MQQSSGENIRRKSYMQFNVLMPFWFFLGKRSGDLPKNGDSAVIMRLRRPPLSSPLLSSKLVPSGQNASRRRRRRALLGGKWRETLLKLSSPEVSRGELLSRPFQNFRRRCSSWRSRSAREEEEEEERTAISLTV